MRRIGFRLMMIFALFAIVTAGIGCSKEDMTEPDTTGEALWSETGEQIDGIILSMHFNLDEDLFVQNLSNKSALLYTPDGGATWALTDSVDSDGVVYEIRSFTFDREDDLIVGTKAGHIFFSSDNGDSLKLVSSIGIESFTDVRGLEVNKDSEVFAAVFGAGVYRSSDNCQTWTNVGSGLGNKDFVMNGLAISSTGLIYVSCWGGEVYKSADNGDSWEELSRLASNYQTIQVLGFRRNGDLIGGYDGGFAVYKEIGTVESEWQKLGYGFPEAGVDIRCFAVDSDGVIYAGTYGDGVFRSENDGFAWSNVSTGIRSAQIMAMAVRPSDKKVFVGTYNKGIYYNIK